MCNCTKELENGGDGKLAEWVQKKHKATIKSAEYREIAFPLVRGTDGSTKMKCVTFSTLRITTNEKKRPVDCTILHSYCPFCGVKYHGGIMRHLNYLKYILRHKWFVFVACLRIGASPWLAIIHDASKFKPSEWMPYACCFYAPDGSKQYKEGMDFTYAWNHHQKRNKHHWQYWLITWDRGTTEPLPMPRRYVLEMVADWMGAGRAITGKWETREWYDKNKTTIQIHSETRAQVEAILYR